MMDMSKKSQHITLDRVLDDLGEPRWRATQRRLLAFFLIIFLWTLIGRVDRVVTAPGKVIPFDKVKVIQHLEGGIIKDIVVRENQEVKAGDPLVELDLATSGINSGEMNARMASLKMSWQPSFQIWWRLRPTASRVSAMSDATPCKPLITWSLKIAKS